MGIKSEAWLYNRKLTFKDYLWLKFATNNSVYTWLSNDVEKKLQSI